MEKAGVKRLVSFGAVTWVVLNLADWLTSVGFISKGVYEFNTIVTQLNPPAFFAFKLFVPIAVLFLLYKWRKLHLLKPLNIIMAVIVCWNVIWWVV